MNYVLPLLLDGQELETRCPVIYTFPAIVFRFPATETPWKKEGKEFHKFIFIFSNFKHAMMWLEIIIILPDVYFSLRDFSREDFCLYFLVVISCV